MRSLALRKRRRGFFVRKWGTTRTRNAGRAFRGRKKSLVKAMGSSPSEKPFGEEELQPHSQGGSGSVKKGGLPERSVTLMTQGGGPFSGGILSDQSAQKRRTQRSHYFRTYAGSSASSLKEHIYRQGAPARVLPVSPDRKHLWLAGAQERKSYLSPQDKEISRMTCQEGAPKKKISPPESFTYQMGAGLRRVLLSRGRRLVRKWCVKTIARVNSVQRKRAGQGRGGVLLGSLVGKASRPERLLYTD